MERTRQIRCETWLDVKTCLGEGFEECQNSRQSRIGSDLPDIAADGSAQIPFVVQNARDSRVEVKLVCNLKQAHKSNCASGKNMLSGRSIQAHLIDRNVLRPG